MTAVPAVSALVLAASLAACAAAPQQAASIEPAADGALRCRELLVIGSNMLKLVCGTEEQWERYDRLQSYSAQALTLRMQGSSFSGGY